MSVETRRALAIDILETKSKFVWELQTWHLEYCRRF